jgi:hypothetical protein
MSRRSMVIKLALLSIALTLAGLILFALAPGERVPVGLHLGETFPFIAMQLSFGVVGAAVSLRRPENPIGWLLSVGGLNASLEYFAAGYMTYGLLSDSGLPAADLAAWVWTWGGMLLALPFAPVLFLFPDGRLRSVRDRLGVVVGVVACVLLAVVLALRPGPLLGIAFAQNPFGWREGARLLDLVISVPVVLVLATIVLAALSLRERSRTGSDLERRQLKWLYAGTFFYLIVYAVVLPVLFGDAFGRVPEPLVGYLARLGAGLAFAIFPIAIGVAILRYRLYDIDLLIKRTVVYGATSAAIAATFFIGIVALQAALRPLTAGSDLAVAASTLVSFALFQPIRRRIRSAVDRRFDRSRYDASRTLDTFADQLRDEVDLDTLRTDLIDAVRRTMAPAHASLWLRQR